MRIFGLFMCIVGVVITAAGVVAYFGDDRGWGIAGFVFGVGTGAIGVMIYLTDFIHRMFRRRANLLVRFQLCKLKFELQGELGSPLLYEEETVSDLEGESQIRNWSD
jgi:hypothetical protein